jgi:hypothetical protein
MAKRPPRKERPLWVPRDKTPASGPTVVVKGRNARELTRQLSQQAKALPAAQPVPPNGPALPRAFRFRWHLIPLAWLAAAGLGFPAHYAGLWVLALLGFLTACVAISVLTRHLPPFTRSRTQAFAGWADLAGTVTAIWGLVRLLDLVLLGVWLFLTLRWVAHFGWRPPRPGQAVKMDTSVHATWARLAAKNKWSAHLGTPRQIPNGEQYPIVCDGAVTHIDQIMDRPSAIAAAYNRPITEAYVEPDPSGVKSRGVFTRLRTGTLDEVREWNGQAIDLRTGLAMVGRFPDGKPVQARYFILPRDGTKHELITGCDGSGKTGAIDLGLSISAVSGLVAPVILDPQMGQALPAWRDHVTYACGTEECMTYLRALHAAMMDRSEYLGSVIWFDDRGGQRRRRRGMGFFNPFVDVLHPDGTIGPLGLPIIEITIDESPVLLACKGAVPLVLDLAKLGRKVGFRLRLAAQVPSMKELGASELRSILNGGSVFCLRAGDKVSGGMVNIQAPPWQLPKVFANGEPTYGLGYAATIDNRPSSPMRTDWVPDPYEVAETASIRRLDDRAAAKMAEIIAGENADADQLRSAADAASRVVLTVLLALREPKTMGELIAYCQRESIPMSAVTDALDTAISDGDVRLDGTVYRLAAS